MKQQLIQVSQTKQDTPLTNARFRNIFYQIMANEKHNISKPNNKTQEAFKNETQTPRTKCVSFDYYIFKRLISRPFRENKAQKTLLNDSQPS